MKDIKQRFEENYLLGCIKYMGKYDFYLMPIAWWILNHDKYDPDYANQQLGDKFRDNINNVLEEDVPMFIKSIEEDRLSLDEVKDAFKKVPSDYTYLYFFVNFDNKVFVSAFPDIEVEEYLPDESWKGMYDVPANYLPDELKGILER